MADGARPGTERLGGFEVGALSGGVAVVVKPAGVAAEMRADTRGVSLLERVKADGWPDARLPHRLDKVTSGLQVVARDPETVAALNAAMQSTPWQKYYVTRIHARHDDAARLLGEHRRYLRRKGRVAQVVRSGGKPARLVVEAVAPDPERPDLHQVGLRLLTGRYHQIRAMLADLGCPLVGDDRYGGAPEPGGPWLEHGRLDLCHDGATLGTTLTATQRRFPWAAEVAAAIERP